MVLTKTVVVYYPSWHTPNTAYQDIDYDAITHIAYAFAIVYFDGSNVVQLDTTDSLAHGYSPDAVIAYAHARSKQVLLSVQDLNADVANRLLADNASGVAARARLINLIEAEVIARGFDGVDNDIEQAAKTASNKAKMTEFQQALTLRMWGTVPPPEPPATHYAMSAAISSNYENGTAVWDLTALADYLDWFLVMGYDWYGNWDPVVGGPRTAGPNAPIALDNGMGLLDGLTKYEALLPDRYKLVLAVPFYGRFFRTVDVIRLAQMSVPYSVVAKNYNDLVNLTLNSSLGTKVTDPTWKTPWYVYSSGFMDNGDFETDRYAWTEISDGGNPVFAPYQIPGRDGTGHCAKISAATTSSGYYNQYIDVDCSLNYNISGYLKTDNVVAAPGYGAAIQIDWFNTGPPYTFLASSFAAVGVQGTNNWTQYSVHIYPSDASDPSSNKVPHGVFLFTWENVPGSETDTLKNTLNTKYGLSWILTSTVTKTDGNTRITFTGTDSSFNMVLNGNSTKVAVDVGNGWQTDSYAVIIESSLKKVYVAANLAAVIPILKNASGTVWFDDIVFDTDPPFPATWRQVHFDDPTSLAVKYEMAITHGYQGIGVWDSTGATQELWTQIKDTFSGFPDVYVDGGKVDNTGTGLSWAQAKKYMISGYAMLAEGGTLHVSAGDYSGQAAIRYNKSFYLSPEDPLLTGFKYVIIPKSY